MAGEKFFLNFINDSFGKVQIDEPIGYNTLSFDFMQKDKGFGRDIVFNSGTSQISFSSQRNHYLDKLIYYNHYFGFESVVELQIEFPSGVIVIQDLDFSQSQTDDYEYFNCKLIQRNALQIVKRRSSVKVDLFNPYNIDGNYIDVPPTQKILMKPKSVLQQSVLSQTSFDGAYMEAKTKTTHVYQGNPCQVIDKSDIDNTVSFLQTFQDRPPSGDSNYYILDVQKTMIDTVITISGANILINTDYANGGNGYIIFNLFVIYGQTEASGTKITLIDQYLDLNPAKPSFTFNQGNDLSTTIPMLQFGDKVWVYFQWTLRQSSDFFVSIPNVSCRTTITDMKITINSEVASNYSVSSGIRLIDAIKQIVKSIAGLDVTAPIFDQGSIYYNTFLLTGNLLRGITPFNEFNPLVIDRGFFISLDDIANSITECNADYEINDTVFFGTEKDYYNPIECGFFDSIQFQDFTKTFNDRMSIIQFSYKYNKYQALKENELPQTADTVHGESIMTLFNKNVENIKEVTIDWIRDSFLIEEARAKALELSDLTSYQNDDSIFAIDTIAQTSDQQYKVVDELMQEYDDINFNLVLKTNNLNFVIMGIEILTDFTILAPDKNAGSYIVVGVENNILTLTSNSASPTKNNNGIRITVFEYTILFSAVPLTNYTTQGITNIGNSIGDPNSYSNLRFSLRRNIENYYSPYLSTCNQYWSDKPMTVTWYKNNRNFTCTYNKLTTLESGNFTPTNKILTCNLFQNVIFANVGLDDYFTLQNNLRTNRGYIRTIDKNNNVIKIFPTKMTYQVLGGELNITGEEKFEPSQMTISTANTDTLINNETSLHWLDYSIVDDKLYIYDNHRELLYNGVFWDMVQINGANAKSISELDTLMQLVKSKNQ